MYKPVLSYLTVLIHLALLAAAGCIKNDSAADATAVHSGSAQGQANTQAASGLHVVLPLTDLGLADGDMVRSADSKLRELAKSGQLRYEALGRLPQPLEAEAGGDDVGLPAPGSAVGGMTLSKALSLVATAPACDLLVLSSGYLLPGVLKLAAEGQVQTRAVLLLDEQGLGQAGGSAELPVYRLRYELGPVAYACGVASGASANMAHFGILYADDDPQGAEFAAAAHAGIIRQNNGAWIETMKVGVGPGGYVTPKNFSRAFSALQAQGGKNWRPNHYIVALGRATPSIVNALSKKPTNAYLVSAYGDLRQVRPARVIACALKQPGPALQRLLSAPATSPEEALAALQAACDASGCYLTGLDDGGIGVTDMSMYNRYNMDGEDIGKAMSSCLAAIKAGELQIGD